MKLAFEPIWPWPLTLLTLAALLFVLRLGYPGRVSHLSTGWQRALMTLRLLLILIIGLWIARPVALYEKDDSSDAAIYLLLDNSRSMNTPDAPGGVSRRQAMLNLYDQARPLLEEFGDSVEVRVRNLSSELSPVDEPSPTAEGRYTILGDNLQTLAEEATQEKIAMVLLWSDGRQATTGNKRTSPVQAARLAGRQHCPIYTVCHGSSELTDTTLDVGLSEFDVPRDVFERNAVPLKVRLKALGAEGRNVQLRVFIEERAGLPIGEFGPMKAVLPDANGNRTLVQTIPADQIHDEIVDLQFVPTTVGEVKIAVEAEALDKEVRLTNNRVEAIIRVRSGGIRVAYFDNLRPEFKWLRRINVSERVQLDSMWVKRGPFANRNEFDESWFEPGLYDAFIIGDVPAELFGQERLKQLALCCEQGAGLMMLGGQTAFGPGGYGNSPLAPLFPLVMTESDDHISDKVTITPTSASINNPILQIAPPDQNSQRWSELAPLTGANVLRVRPASAAQVLAESPNGLPLLIGQNVGSARILAFAGDTTWQWALREDWSAEAHQRFWRQVIFWLTRIDDDGEKALWVNVSPRDITPGALAELTFGLRDDQGLPLSNVDYTVTVQKPNGEKDSLDVRAIETYAAADFTGTDEPGDYIATVAAPGPGGEMNYSSRRFLVNMQDPELDNPAADPALMREIAHVSGGDYLSPDEMIQRMEQWAENGLPSLEMKRQQRISLWDNYPSLLIFVALLTAEWFLRKKRGLV